MMPAVNEYEDDRIPLGDFRFDELNGLICLARIPKPTFVICLDKVQRIIASFHARLLTGSIRLMSVRRAACEN
jgi:hypothetical protein